jgi:hypothetical protein
MEDFYLLYTICELDIWLIYKINFSLQLKIISIVPNSAFDITFCRLLPCTLSDTQGNACNLSLILPHLTSSDGVQPGQSTSARRL